MIRDFAKLKGFKEIEHKTIGDSLIYDLGRTRMLILSNAGNGNEMLAIASHSSVDNRRLDDIVIIHNYDYDGFITEGRLTEIINVLSPEKTKNE